MGLQNGKIHLQTEQGQVYSVHSNKVKTEVSLETREQAMYVNTEKRRQDGSFLVYGPELDGLQGALNHLVGGKGNDTHFHRHLNTG